MSVSNARLTVCHAAQVVSLNVSQEDIQAGLDEYMSYGVDSQKNRIALDCNNFGCRVSIFERYNYKKPGESLQHILLRMVRGGKFYPSCKWVVPMQGHGLDRNRAEAWFRMLKNPRDTMFDDIAGVFFDDSKWRYYKPTLDPQQVLPSSSTPSPPDADEQKLSDATLRRIAICCGVASDGSQPVVQDKGKGTASLYDVLSQPEYPSV